MKQSILFLISIIAFLSGGAVCVTAWAPIIPALIVAVAGCVGMYCGVVEWEDR